MAALTVATAFTQFGYYKQDIADVSTNLQLQWANQINRYIYRKLAEADPERFISTSTINAVAGTNSYSLPASFMHIQANGCGLYKQDSNGYATDERLTMTGYGQKTTGFYINGGNIILTPPNWNETQTYILRYIPVPPGFTQTTDYFTTDKTGTGTIIIDDQYIDYIIKAIDVQYSQWDEDGALESIDVFRFIRVLDDS